MSSPALAPSSPRLRPAPPAVRWRSWPLVETPWRAFAALIVLVAIAVATRWVTGQPHLAGLAVSAIILAGWRFYVPIWYELDLEGVHQTVFRRRRVIPWTAIRSCEMAAAGVLLLPNADAVPLDAWIGLYLPWSGRREEVLANLIYYLGKQSDVDARV